MARKSNSAQIDSAIFNLISVHPKDLVRVVANNTKLSKVAVVKRVNQLIMSGHLVKQGTTRPVYLLGINRNRIFNYGLTGLSEDRVWSSDIAPLLSGLPRNIYEICQFGLTEMINNAIDHSEGSSLMVSVQVDENAVEFLVQDNGYGIFKKIKRHFNLEDIHLAILELSKGKLTTDSKNHTGEGIFFTSRMFDEFWIFSSEMVYGHSNKNNNDYLFDDSALDEGTSILMSISRSSSRTRKDVFSEYSSGPDEFSFEKTIVPVRLAIVGDENLVSRSQAKRLVTRFDRFRKVILDFAGVSYIGQAFSDELFRVFANDHPGIELIPVGANPEVQQMINRALNARLLGR